MFKLSLSAIALLLSTVPHLAVAADALPADPVIERGRYLVQITGCNDCHTPNYAMSSGKVAQSEWLTGDHLGWRGPWGTTYPPNLRLFFANISESDWLALAHNAAYRPPMPSPVLRDMTDDDLRALYRFVRALGPAGEPAPAYVAPGIDPVGPVVSFPMPPG